MRSFLCCLFFVCAADSRAELFLAIDDSVVDVPPLIELDVPADIQLVVHNTGTATVPLQNSQVSIAIVPLAGTVGELDLAVGTASNSLFSANPIELFASADVITASVGVLPPLPSEQLLPGQAKGLLSITLTPLALASGRFEIVASGVSADPLLSSHYVSPPNFLLRQPFQNSSVASNGQVLLATVEIASVPEPSTVCSVMYASLAYVTLRRSRPASR